MHRDRHDVLRTAAGFAAAVLILGGAGVYALPGARPAAGAEAPAAVTPPQLLTQAVDTLRRGETLSDLFVRQGLPAFTLSDSSSRGLLDPRRLRPGLVFNFLRRAEDSVPSRVVVRTSPEERVALHLASDGWLAVSQPIFWQAVPVVLGGPIESSLYDALDADISDSVFSAADRVRLAWDLADVFAWQVDFSRDIRSGDSFRVVVERLLSEDGDVRLGRVLAADLTVGGNRFNGYRFTDANGATGYYDAEGRSLRRAFLLAPVEFRRISSRFNGARKHPILGIVRRHEGTDFAADPGTPVMASGNGVVSRMGWHGGYGNLVEIRHAHGIVTRYGHLRGFAKGIKPGTRVTQGEVIGYVGSTGLATGPHLHYEFRVNGVARDPRKVDLGSGEPVPASARADFERERARLDLLLAGTAGPSLAALPSDTAPPAVN